MLTRCVSGVCCGLAPYEIGITLLSGCALCGTRFQPGEDFRDHNTSDRLAPDDLKPKSDTDDPPQANAPQGATNRLPCAGEEEHPVSSG